MTPAEILDYTLQWWDTRATKNKEGVYLASLHGYDSKDLEVVVKTPWNTYHTAIRVVWGDIWKDNARYSCWQSLQYHFTGWLPISELNKRKLYNLMRTQRRILETSTTL